MWKGQTFPRVPSIRSLLVVGRQRERKVVATEMQHQDETGLENHSSACIFPVVAPYGNSTLSQGQHDKTAHAFSAGAFKEGRNHPHCSRETTGELFTPFGNTPTSFPKAH